MNRFRRAAIVSIAATTALLALTACGDGDDSSSDSSSTDKSALVDDLMGVVAGEDTPDEGCIRKGLEGFSTEELQTLKDAAAEPGFDSGSEPITSLIPAALGDKVTELSDDCVGTTPPENNVPVEGDPGTSVPLDGGP